MTHMDALALERVVGARDAPPGKMLLKTDGFSRAGLSTYFGASHIKGLKAGAPRNAQPPAS
jgi:hypothetical protein